MLLSDRSHAYAVVAATIDLIVTIPSFVVTGSTDVQASDPELQAHMEHDERVLFVRIGSVLDGALLAFKACGCRVAAVAALTWRGA